MKPLHQPITGDDLLAVARYQDDTRHMIEFQTLLDSPMGRSGQHIRRYLSEDGYAQALRIQQQGGILIRRHYHVIEGHILPEKPKKRRK